MNTQKASPEQKPSQSPDSAADPYADWRTDLERIAGDPNCRLANCHGRGWVGLSKLPGGKTMIVACRCAKVNPYPVHQVLRPMVREESAVTRMSVLSARQAILSDIDIALSRLNIIMFEVTTPWWKKVFRASLPAGLARRMTETDLSVTPRSVKE